MNKLKKKVLKAFRPPFVYEPYAQMIMDDKGKHVLDIRGWGYLQKFEDAEDIQDSMGKLVTKLLNNEFEE